PVCGSGSVSHASLSASIGTGASTASMTLGLAGKPLEVPGRVVRLEGEADASTRLVKVVVEFSVADLPEKLQAKLLPGLFVDVTIHGPQLPDITRIARSVLRDNGSLWIVRDGRLEIIRPDIVYADGDEIYVAGLTGTTAVVTTNLDVVVTQMKVRIPPSAFPSTAETSDTPDATAKSREQAAADRPPTVTQN
ncbi:MAG: hypothetical protein AAFY88_21130, partial [Acidobacteriota bacterium]